MPEQECGDPREIPTWTLAPTGEHVEGWPITVHAHTDLPADPVASGPHHVVLASPPAAGAPTTTIELWLVPACVRTPPPGLLDRLTSSSLAHLASPTTVPRVQVGDLLIGDGIAVQVKGWVGDQGYPLLFYWMPVISTDKTELVLVATCPTDGGVSTCDAAISAMVAEVRSQADAAGAGP